MVPQLQALRPAELDVPAIVESALRYGMQRLPSEGSPSSAVGCKLLIQKKKKLPLQMAHLNEIKHLQRLVSNSGVPVCKRHAVAGWLPGRVAKVHRGKSCTAHGSLS